MRKNKTILISSALALVIFVAAGLTKISFNIDILKLLPTHLPQVEGLSIFLKKFSQPEELILTVSAPDAAAAEKAVSVLTSRFQSRPDLVAQTVSGPPWEKDPAQLSELLAFLLLNQPPKNIARLAESLTPQSAPETVRSTLEKLSDSLSSQEVAMLSYDPYGLTSVIGESGLFSQAQQSEFSSADGTFRVIYLKPGQKFANYKENIRWINQIKNLAASPGIPSMVRLGFTGEPAFVADISGSMQWDMASSGFITLLVIAVIFWVCYRRTKPLFSLQVMLVLIFTISLAAAGLLLKELTVIGVGFASIMIGLSVDYGYLVYQKSLHHTGTLRELQMECLQNIMWTAGTTAAAFFALNFSSLPGLSQLGNLVGIGVITGGAVMLLVFAPMTLRWKKENRREEKMESWIASRGFVRSGTWLVGIMVIGLIAVLLWKGLPMVDPTTKSLRPRNSGAYDALDQLTKKLTDDSGFLSLIVRGKSEPEVLQKLIEADHKLSAAQERGDLKTYRSPLPLWPNSANQAANIAELEPFVKELPRLHDTAIQAGFTEDSFHLTTQIFEKIQEWSARKLPVWPENETSHWIYRRLANRSAGDFVAMGMVNPVPGHEDALASAIQGDGVWLVSWTQLGSELKRVIPGEFARLILTLLGIVLVLLGFAFGGIRDLLVLVATLGLVFVSLLGTMSLLGMSWNFFNLAGILLLLGTGIDYSILLLLALKRNGGNIVDARKSYAMVIFLCAGSASAGFGTISWANNQGLASLGQTCALGLALDALISVFLLPVIWKMAHWKRC